ncbi:MAG: hypothetical protein LOD91_04615, partial [Limnochordales bacterium]
MRDGAVRGPVSSRPSARRASASIPWKSTNGTTRARPTATSLGRWSRRQPMRPYGSPFRQTKYRTSATSAVLLRISASAKNAKLGWRAGDVSRPSSRDGARRSRKTPSSRAWMPREGVGASSFGGRSPITMVAGHRFRG